MTAPRRDRPPGREVNLVNLAAATALAGLTPFQVHELVAGPGALVPTYRRGGVLVVDPKVLRAAAGLARKSLSDGGPGAGG
jgi:hypothetical protein